MITEQKKQLSNVEKILLSQVKNELCREILRFVCLGESGELTPVACQNLIKGYLDLQDEKEKHKC